MRIRKVDDNKIADWCNQSGIQFKKVDGLVDNTTFHVSFFWIINNEEHYVFFKLKWGCSE